MPGRSGSGGPSGRRITKPRWSGCGNGTGTAGARGSSSASCSSHQDWALDRVSAALQEALDGHCPELEAVRHILMREDMPARAHAPLESGLMPGITDLTIAGADLDQYDRLLTGSVR